MADFNIRFDDFKGGDWGVRDPARADRDQFSGENVAVYRSGLIGPRAGLKQLTFTGLPTHPVSPGPMGFGAFGTKLLIVLNHLFEVPQAGGAAAAYTNYPAPAATPVRFVVGNSKLYSLLNGVLYRHDGLGATVAVGTPVAFKEIIRWGPWMVAWGLATPWRLYFNQVDAAGSNFDSWPANNFIDIGNSESIVALEPVYNTLYVGKREGWWALSGVLGTLASVRDVVVSNGPIDTRFSAVTADNRIVYWPPQSTPAFFNTERVTLEEDQQMPARVLPAHGDFAVATPTGKRILLAADDADGTQLFLWSKQAWTKHRFPVKLGGFAPNEARQGSQMPEGVIYAVQRPTTVGDAPVICAFSHDLDRPGHTSDVNAAPSDLGSSELVLGMVSLPAWFEPQGRQVRVRSLVVQFRKWASGSESTTNRMQVRVDALGKWGGGTELGEPQEWIQASLRSPTDGADDSWRVEIGAQGYGNGFQIVFLGLAGVAIREVVAVCDVKQGRD